jgi:hypothetical protein
MICTVSSLGEDGAGAFLKVFLIKISKNSLNSFVDFFGLKTQKLKFQQSLIDAFHNQIVKNSQLSKKRD